MRALPKPDTVPKDAQDEVAVIKTLRPWLEKNGSSTPMSPSHVLKPVNHKVPDLRIIAKKVRCFRRRVVVDRAEPAPRNTHLRVTRAFTATHEGAETGLYSFYDKGNPPLGRDHVTSAHMVYFHGTGPLKRL